MGVNVKKEVILQSFCTCEGKCYASALKVNGLFLVEPDGEAEFLALFPGERIKKGNLYADAVACGKYVFFVPAAAENICIYDTQEHIFKVLSVRTENAKGYNKNSKFCTAVNYHGSIYFFPETYPAIVKVECESWEVTYIDKWLPEERVCFKKGICVKGDKVIIPSTLSRIYMEFNLCDEVVKLKQLPFEDNNSGAWSVCVHDTDYWFVAYPGPAIARMDTNNHFEKYDYFPENFQDNGYAFAMSFLHGKDLYACPVRSNMLLKVNTESGEMEEAAIEKLVGDNLQLMYLCQMDHVLVFCRYDVKKNAFNADSVEQVFLDTKNLKIHVCNLKIKNEYDYLQAIMNVKITEENQLVESKELNLENFLVLVSNSQSK